VINVNVYDYYVTPEEYEIAQKNGISPGRVNDRIRNYGWSKKDAITIPPMKMKPFNEKYVKLAESNGISRDTFRLRVRHYGMSEYEAATKPLQDRKKQANIMQKKRKKYPDELLELAKKNGIKYTTFIARINRLRWDPLKAATTKRMEVSK
jgi:uncharacterized protein YjcR